MSNNHRFIWIAIASAAAAAAVTLVALGPDSTHLRWLGVSSASKANSDKRATVEPIKIGVAVGLSGANSVVAPTVVQSAQLAVDEINETGGILGRKVQLEIMDDGSGASGSKTAMEALIFQKKVDAVIAMETSAARTAALPVVSQGKVPYIYTSFYEGRACNEWLYVNGWVPEQQVTPVVQYLAKEKGARTFFLVGSDYAFGRGMLDFARKLIRESGGEVVGEEYLPMDESDWTAVVSKIRTTKPDALISATAGGEPNVSLAMHLRGAGLKMPYGNLAIDESTAKSMGTLATGMLVSASYFTSIDSPENVAFLKRMLIRFGADLKAPNELSVPQYEAFHLYRAAVQKAGTTDAAKVVEALGTVAYDGPRGRIEMSRGRHAVLSMKLGQVRSNGSITILQTFPAVDPGSQCSSSS